jgi:hypothetical protein
MGSVKIRSAAVRGAFMLVQLIYVSTPVAEKMEEVNASLPSNQLRNKEREISGLILSHPNFYLQILEGERATVSKLFHKIMCDNRHTDVTIVRFQDSMRTEFSRWDYAVIDENLDKDFYEYINDLVDVNIDFKRDMSSSCAMAVLRRAFAILTMKNVPNRRATDVKELPQLCA